MSIKSFTRRIIIIMFSVVVARLQKGVQIVHFYISYVLLLCFS